MKSSLIMREILTAVIIERSSISKNYTSSVVLSGRAILEELILRIALAAGAIYSSTDPALLAVCGSVNNSSILKIEI